MKILKNLFGDGTKIHADNIEVGTSGNHRSLSDGVIIESGSNTNGTYIKFGDGTMICRQSVFRTASGSGTIDTSLSFPSLFSSPPNVIGQMQDTGSQSWSGNLYLGDVAGNSIRIVIIGGGSGVSYYINYIAIGRWK